MGMASLVTADTEYAHSYTTVAGKTLFPYVFFVIFCGRKIGAFSVSRPFAEFRGQLPRISDRVYSYINLKSNRDTIRVH